MDIGDRSGNPTRSSHASSLSTLYARDKGYKRQVVERGLLNWEGRVGCANNANEDLSSQVLWARSTANLLSRLKIFLNLQRSGTFYCLFVGCLTVKIRLRRVAHTIMGD